ncbi:hypothetical protein Tco_1379113 [Tanacetum coccineum]
MLLNLDQLEKKLGKEEFQETESMDAFRALKTQFQLLINFQDYFDYFDDGPMIRKYFLAYTRTKVRQFRDALIQHMESIKKSINERAQLKRDSGTESEKHDTSSRFGNDAHAEDVDIKPVNDKEPMAESIENADLKAQIQEKVFANAALKNELRKLKGNSVDTKFVKASILGKPPIQPSRNHSVVRQPNAFKESAPAKPHHVNEPSSSRNYKKESYGSNDIAHNHFLEEDRKKTQDRNWNLKPREMPSAKTHHTPNACTPKPISNNQTFRNCPASKSSNVKLNVVQKADHSRNPSSCSNFKHLVCSTCQKCVFNANHDDYITKFLKEVNSGAKYFKPPPNVDHPVPEVPTPVPTVSTCSPSSTTVDQDAPSTSTSQTTSEQQSSVIPQGQNQRDLPRDNPLVSVEVLRYDIKRSKSENKGIVPTEMELVLEQTQQGTSHEVSVSTEGVEE